VKVLRIGIASANEFKARTIAIALGRRKVKPGNQNSGSARPRGRQADRIGLRSKRSGGVRRGT
jgi:hypothetical protein